MNQLFSLEHKVAIVTGGNTGIGRAVAKALAQAGADIAVVSRGDADAIEREVAQTGRRFLHVRADLSQMDSIPVVVESVLAAFGKIDILVNNAGIIRREDSLLFTEQDWDDVLGLNTKALFFLSQAVAKQMVKQGTGGKIISTASLLSFQGGIRVPAYTASKSAVKGMTMLMANEWAKYNIQVNAVAPGYIETDNTAALRADEKRNMEILSRIPAGRWGKPEDLAGAYVYLASDASNYVTGFTIAVDGGWLAR